MRPIDREVCRTVGEQMIEAAATYPERDMPDWARWDGELAEFQVGSLTVRCRPFREIGRASCRERVSSPV